ncbi:hypothetical protein EZY14_009230 [Kordia sp. TARA_039_SRF]|nr:hypothetical protein EZY14_009230 [Kordia sp. TARA_039_SRF]
MNLELILTCKELKSESRKVLMNNKVYISFDYVDGFNLPLEKGVEYRVNIEPVTTMMDATEFANKIVTELQDKGLTLDEILGVIHLTREKLDNKKNSSC